MLDRLIRRVSVEPPPDHRARRLAVMAAGWVSYRRLPVDAFPDVSPNLVQVFTVTEGLAPGGDRDVRHLPGRGGDERPPGCREDPLGLQLRPLGGQRLLRRRGGHLLRPPAGRRAPPGGARADSRGFWRSRDGTHLHREWARSSSTTSRIRPGSTRSRSCGRSRTGSSSSSCRRSPASPRCSASAAGRSSSRSRSNPASCSATTSPCPT